MANQPAPHEPQGNGESQLSRRALFQYSGLAAAAVGGSSLLAACGGGDDDSGGSDGGGAQASGGILVHGATGGSAKDTLDPHSPVQNADIARCSNLYEPLLFWDNNYELAPALAESVEPSKDAKTWTVKLREGVTFHNGKDVTPEDVLFTINRVADPKAPTSAGSILSQILDFDATKKVDATTVQIVTKEPYALLDSLLAEYTFGIIPEDFDINNPVGTGAFSYESFDPGKTAPSRSSPTTGASRPSSTSSASRTSPTTTRRSTRCSPARCRPSTTCRPTSSTRSRARADRRSSPTPARGCRSRCASTWRRSTTPRSVRRCA